METNKLAFPVAVVAVLIAIISLWVTVTSQWMPNTELGATGTRFPNGISLGTTTPSSTADLNVDVLNSTGTTTVLISSAGSAKGGCIQLKGVDGKSYFIYATTTVTASSPVYWSVGTCK